MKVLVLAAGKSKRMSPVSDKNFLNFLGKTLIERQLEALKAAGFDDIVLVAGAHNKERMSELGVKVVEQTAFTQGMSAAVLAAESEIASGPVLIFSSNDVVDQSAFEMIMEASKGEADSYILGKKVEQYFPGGYLEVDESGMMKSIVEKPGAGNEPSDLVNLVVHLHMNPADLIGRLKAASSSQDDHYEVALDEMIGEGKKLQVVEYDGFWQPVKFPWHVHAVWKYFFEKAEKGVSEEAQIAESAVINGDVIIEEGVKIFDGAVINGPVYIGKNSVVANGSLVRDSHLGEDSVIGFATELARSFLGDEVWTHSNYIGDSVIGSNVSFGAGAVTGNLRLDEENVMSERDGQKVDSQTNKLGLITGDHVRVGVNVSTMPGVSIGSNSAVGPGVILNESVGENSFVRMSSEIKQSENRLDISKLSRKALKDKLED